MDSENEWQDEASVDQLPGYAGLIFDDLLEFSDGLTPLIDFDFQHYGVMADELSSHNRCLELKSENGFNLARFDARFVHEIVASIPYITATYDCPPNQGPGGGAGYIFLLNDGCMFEEANEAAKSLRRALDADFFVLKDQYEQAV